MRGETSTRDKFWEFSKTIRLKMDSLQMAERERERGRPEVINAENVAMPCIREIAIGNNNFGDSETLLRTEDRAD